MLIVGHEAPFQLSALARRIESHIRFAKPGNSRQVSGTSDASKTQSGLIVNHSRHRAPNLRASDRILAGLLALLGTSNSFAPFCNCTEAFDIASPSHV
jgi:hypothetical protein